jgi:general secretion pathway protein E
MAMSDRIKSILHDQSDQRLIGEAAREDGLLTLKEVAVKKLLDGVTTVEEVLAVTGLG